MKLSLTMEYVLLRAAQEASAFSQGTMGQEHLFLGILKLPEITGQEMVKDASRAGEFDREAAEIAQLAQQKGWDTAALRQKLRSYLSNESPSRDGEQQIEYLLGSAAYHARQDRHSEAVTAADVLGAILRHPSPMIAALLEGKSSAASTGSAPESVPSESAEPEPEGIAFLPVLTRRIRALRYELLDQVFGQDHAVHALTEGLFSAEVLAASDKRRKGPKAVFLFAGPPGVGKTFMAERTAAALKLPFQRFDMSSFADHQAHMGLIGFAPSFKDAKAGQLTGFVEQHPRCLLLFDEVEKAHRNTIQLFLQILDGGRLHDDFLDRDVDFHETLVIFTTNAGRQLYEGDNGDLSRLPRQSVLSALKSDVDPLTKQPYFPSAICSRLSTGFVLMFNHLRAFDRGRICETELKRFSGLFEEQYGIRVGFDRLLPMTLLFSEGSRADARTLRAQTELFCKNEIYRLCGLWGEDSFETALQRLAEIQFTVDIQGSDQAVQELFVNPELPELLLYGSEELCEQMSARLPRFRLLCASTPEEVYALAGKHEPLFLLSDLSHETSSAPDLFDDPFAEDDWDDVLTTRLLNDSGADKLITSFDSVPPSAPSLHGQISFLKEFRERMPDVAVYVLESPQLRLDEELMSAFSRLGVRGRLLAPVQEFDVFSEQLEELAEQCYLQRAAESLGAEQQILAFSAETSLSQDSRTASIKLTELEKKRAVEAEDMGDLLDDVERSHVHFADVIGAEEAKEELRFFVEYLKNPRRFLAQGLKPPKGVLLYGPAGTGKTLLARAMAGEAEVPFIATEATSFVTKWQGSGPESIRTLFRKARRYAPSIVFIDEIDAIGRARGAGSGHGEEMALNALLTEMDGFRVNPRRPVFVLAATNYGVERTGDGTPALDPALSRRFDRKILVELPDRDQRRAYLDRAVGMDRSDGANRSADGNRFSDTGSAVSEAMLERLANRSAGMSLADLCAVLEQAARQAVRSGHALADEDLDEAFERVRHGSEKRWGEQYMERVACHESGHALLCWLSGRTPAYLTIVARGDHGGYMEHADGEIPLRTRRELMDRIRTALGGRAAELVCYGEEEGISTGASGDLSNATQLAAQLLLQYGMDPGFGLAALPLENLLRGPMAEKLLGRINEILARELEQAAALLREHREALDALTQALLRRNKLTGEEIETICLNCSAND